MSPCLGRHFSILLSMKARHGRCSVTVGQACLQSVSLVFRLHDTVFLCLLNAKSGFLRTHFIFACLFIGLKPFGPAYVIAWSSDAEWLGRLTVVLITGSCVGDYPERRNSHPRHGTTGRHVS